MPELPNDEALCASAFALEWEGEAPTSPEELAHLRAHQEHCPRCAASRALARSADAARALSTNEPASASIDQGWERIAESLPDRTQPSWLAWMLGHAGMTGMAAAALAVALVALGIFWTGGREASPAKPDTELEVAETTPAEEASSPTEVAAEIETLQPAPGILARAEGLDGWSFTPSPKRHRARLKRGRVAADYDRTVTRRDWVIQTPMATLRITGTRFALEASASHTTVMVEEGTVRVEDRKSQVFMVSGGSARTVGTPPQPVANPANAAAEAPPSPPAESVAKRELETILQAVPRQEGHKKLKIERSTKPSQRDQHTPEPANRPPLEEGGPSPKTLLSQHACAELKDGFPQLQQALPNARLQESLNAGALHWRRQGDFVRAGACYDLLEKTNPSPLREASRLEYARLLTLRLGDSPRAFRILHDLARRKDFIGEQAAHEECLILHRQKRMKDAKHCFEAYLESHRNGAFVENVRRLLNELSAP